MTGAGERNGRVVKSMAVLPADLGSIPRTHSAGWLTILFNSNSKGSHALFWPPWAPGTHMVYRKTCRQNTCTCKINNKLTKIINYWLSGDTWVHSNIIKYIKNKQTNQDVLWVRKESHNLDLPFPNFKILKNCKGNYFSWRNCEDVTLVNNQS